MQLRFYPVDVSYKLAGGTPVIHLYGRAADGSQVCVTDASFEPYFWVIGADRDAVAALSVSTTEGEIKPKRVEAHKKRLVRKEITAFKVFAGIPSDIPVLREAASKIGKCLEADILFDRRYLIDKAISPLSLCEAEGEFAQRSKVSVFRAESVRQVSDEVLPSFRILAVDIETHSPFNREIVPEEQPIIMLALAGDSFRKVLTWKRFKTDMDYIEFVGSEVELLERFVQLVEEYKPDMITGYYSDAFDLPFIATRAEKYRIALNLGLDYSPIRVNRKQAMVSKVTGIAHFDVLRFVQRVFGRSLKTTAYDLNSVATEVLDEKKEDVDLSRLYEAWENNVGLEAFCKYNLQDALLTLKLAEKLLPNVVELVKVVRLAIDDVSRMSFSQLVEWFLINEAKNFNELVPNRPAYVESRQRFESTYEGAYVYEPTPGFYRDIAVFDFRSLYPTIISAHNISPDTINCDCCIEETLVPQPGSKIWFCRKRKGFISTVIEGIITRRLRIKEIMKTAGQNKMLKAREEALKTIANSMYGYLGFFGARWYSVECARSITAYGRHYIMSVIDKAKKDFNVLYSDTDSIFISLEGKTKYDAERFANDINSSLPGLMELEYEGFYQAGMFVATKAKGYGAKKKYALLTEDGSMKIRGFETVRRNLSLISKELQEKVIGMLLKGPEPEKAAEYVKGVIEMLRAKSAPVEKLVIKTQLQKEVGSYDNIAPHVAVAKRMRQQGKEVGIGTTISYVVVEGDDKISERAKMPEEIKDGEYDAEYYIYNQIIPSVGKIFEIFGINIIEFIEPKLQKKLDAFFG